MYSGRFLPAGSTLLTSCLLIVGLASSPVARAWDDDFHQHLTTLIGKDLGYSDRIAEVAGALSAYTDVSLASGPFLFYNSRVYMHFNGFYPAKILEKKESAPIIESVLSYIRSVLMVSDARSPVPHAFFTHAMKERDLIGMFGHLHSIQDLEPHAGFYSLDGHRSEGHGPDRYWLTLETVNKFRNSIRQTYVALWAARQMLPKEELNLDHGLFLLEDLRRREDPSFKGFSPEERKKLLDQPLVLAEAAINHPDIMAVYSYPFLRDPEYVANGLIWFIQHLQDQGIVSPELNFADIVPPDVKLDGSVDLPNVIAKIMATGHFMKDNQGKDLFHMDRLMTAVFPEFNGQSFEQVLQAQIKIEMASLKANDAAQGDLFLGGHLGPQVDAFGQLKAEAVEKAKVALANRITMFLAKGYITMPIDKYNHVDSFEEPELRHKELEIRQRKWNDLLEKFIGKRVAFDARVLRNRGIIGKTLRKLPFFHPDLFAHRHVHDGADSKELVLTIPQRWRLHWMIRMIRKVLFASPRSVFSAEFLEGATDYQHVDKFKEMVANGDFKPFTKAEIDKLMASYNSPFEKMVDRFVRAIGKGESSPISADGGLLQELKIYSTDKGSRDCAPVLMGGPEDSSIYEEIKKL